MKNNLNQLLEKRMSRKMFLVTAGTIVLTLLGVTGAIKKLSDSTMPKDISDKDKGFGSSIYGGKG